MTVSNIVSPLMNSADRFLIGAILSMTAVAYYVTPYEVVTKLWIITEWDRSVTTLLLPSEY